MTLFVFMVVECLIFMQAEQPSQFCDIIHCPLLTDDLSCDRRSMEQIPQQDTHNAVVLEVEHYTLSKVIVCRIFLFR
jgi:hypothetical protein